MFKVDVLKIKNKFGELSKLLEIYQENYLNMYHQIELSDQDELWYDPHARSFFDDKVIEKSNIEDSYSELNEVYDLINNIIVMYSNIGGVVEFDLSYKNSILSKFNIYKNKLNRVLNSYNNLDYSFASSEIISAIDDQERSIRDQIRLCDILKDNIINIIDSINIYERDISKMIKRIFIKKIQTIDVEKYCRVLGNEEYEKCVINPEEIGNVTKKLNLYSDLESTNFINILNNLKSVIDYYKTTNTISLDSLKDNINNKFNSIIDCNSNNIQVFKRNVDMYTRIDEEVTTDASKMGV